MKLTVETDYLDPIRITKYQWVEVALSTPHKYGNPDDYEVKYEQCEDDEIPEFTVTVFDDYVYVRTADDVMKRKDGTKIWTRPRKKTK